MIVVVIVDMLVVFVIVGVVVVVVAVVRIFVAVASVGNIKTVIWKCFFSIFIFFVIKTQNRVTHHRISDL